MVELIGPVNSVIVFLSQMTKYDSHSAALLHLFISSDVFVLHGFPSIGKF